MPERMNGAMVKKVRWIWERQQRELSRNPPPLLWTDPIEVEVLGCVTEQVSSSTSTNCPVLVDLPHHPSILAKRDTLRKAGRRRTWVLGWRLRERWPTIVPAGVIEERTC